MNKVLIVDKSIDRKKRIAALKEQGFSVFPALQLAEARSRCRPGAYDLIIVNAQDEPEKAAAFCDELHGRTPAQSVLLVVADGAGGSGRDYVVTEDPAAVAKRAVAIMRQSGSGEEEGAAESRQPTSARVSA